MADIAQTSPAELRDGLEQGKVLLVDVREPAEYAAERIPGALLYPLSTFDPKAIPATSGKTLVLHCGGGGRSTRAAQALVAAGVTGVHNLEGGLRAWKALGLPLIRVDPATGQVIEHGKL
ncbi:MAG TPA: rhodanese-like domain-containing protein [Steroidobacteraceae bacterium]|nr:rhodanese-like domain-containing protein [Steroidobacteraceae bacterium]